MASTPTQSTSFTHVLSPKNTHTEEKEKPDKQANLIFYFSD